MAKSYERIRRLRLGPIDVAGKGTGLTGRLLDNPVTRPLQRRYARKVPGFDSTAARVTREDLERIADADPEARKIVDRIKGLTWYHTIDLGHGVETPGFADHRRQLPMYGLPDSLAGKRCLDIATFDGFFAFEFEKRGADEVVAIDIPKKADVDCPRWLLRDPEGFDLTGTMGESFKVAHDILQSKVKRVEKSVYDLDPAVDGMFDLVFISDVLIHLRDPQLAIEPAYSVCKGELIVADVYSPELEAFGEVPVAQLRRAGRDVVVSKRREHPADDGGGRVRADHRSQPFRARRARKQEPQSGASRRRGREPFMDGEADAPLGNGGSATSKPFAPRSGRRHVDHEPGRVRQREHAEGSLASGSDHPTDDAFEVPEHHHFRDRTAPRNALGAGVGRVPLFVVRGRGQPHRDVAVPGDGHSLARPVLGEGPGCVSNGMPGRRVESAEAKHDAFEAVVRSELHIGQYAREAMTPASRPRCWRTHRAWSTSHSASSRYERPWSPPHHLTVTTRRTPSAPTPRVRPAISSYLNPDAPNPPGVVGQGGSERTDGDRFKSCWYYSALGARPGSP